MIGGCESIQKTVRMGGGYACNAFIYLFFYIALKVLVGFMR